MPALICGSLAFDTITTFPGRFAQQILPDQVHILNVSFLVPTMRREFGGTAGNIAYNLRGLGGEPVVLAMLGNDGHTYLDRLHSWQVDTSCVSLDSESYTAQATIITDVDNNQITAFHPGAMSHAHRTPVPQRSDLKLAIVAPDGRDAMVEHADQLAAARIPFVFDPGQGLPMFNGEDLRRFLSQATWVAVNDYEGRMLCERTGSSLAEMSRARHLQGIVVTLGAQGCELWINGERQVVPGVAAREVIDPTGCGDAFRAGLLFGLERGWPLQRCAELGNHLGALKIACAGPQNHEIDRASLGL
jgi:adenosine kinase